MTKGSRFYLPQIAELMDYSQDRQIALIHSHLPVTLRFLLKEYETSGLCER